MSYSSAEHVSKNENGREEITLERTIGIFTWVWRVIKQRTYKVSWRQKDTYECLFGLIWIHKGTEEPASKNLCLELQQARTELTSFTTEMEAMEKLHNTPWKDIKKVIGELHF